MRYACGSCGTHASSSGFGCLKCRGATVELDTFGRLKAKVAPAVRWRRFVDELLRLSQLWRTRRHYRRRHGFGMKLEHDQLDAAERAEIRAWTTKVVEQHAELFATCGRCGCERRRHPWRYLTRDVAVAAGRPVSERDGAVYCPAACVDCASCPAFVERHVTFRQARLEALQGPVPATA